MAEQPNPSGVAIGGVASGDISVGGEVIGRDKVTYSRITETVRTETVRIEIDITTQAFYYLNELVENERLQHGEVLSRSLAIFAAAAKAKEKGYKLGIVDSSGHLIIEFTGL